MNHLILSGHLGKDPEMVYTPGGVAVTKFSIAVKDYAGKKDGQANIITTWVNIVCFGKTAEVANQYLHKGSKVTVDGRLSIRPYEDKNGNKATWTECVANSVDLPPRSGSSDPGLSDEDLAASYEGGNF